MGPENPNEGPSEYGEDLRELGQTRRLLAPLIGALGLIVRFANWPIALLALLYLGSGMTSVAPGEVALVLRWGRLRGSSPAEQVHPSGFLFAWPFPIEEVVRVDTSRSRSLRINDFNPELGAELPRVEGLEFTGPDPDKIDPLREGYLLTGDRNIVQVSIEVTYRVRDAVAYALRHADPEGALRRCVGSATVHAVGGTAVDSILTGGRGFVERAVRTEAQASLDRAGTGLEIQRISLVAVDVPQQVRPAFRQYQSVKLEAQRQLYDENRSRGESLTAARTRRDIHVNNTRAEATAHLGRVRGALDAFESEFALYQESPEVVRHLIRTRTMRHALENAFERRAYAGLSPGSKGEVRITLSTRRDVNQ